MASSSDLPTPFDHPTANNRPDLKAQLNSLPRVEFLVNGALQCTDTTAPYSCVWRVPAAMNKTHQLQARAFDAANNSATAGIQVIAR